MAKKERKSAFVACRMTSREEQQLDSMSQVFGKPRSWVLRKSVRALYSIMLRKKREIKTGKTKQK